MKTINANKRFTAKKITNCDNGKIVRVVGRTGDTMHGWNITSTGAGFMKS